MLLIPTRLGPSPIHGMGVFALEAVAKGVCLWEFEPLLDQIISEETLASLPEKAQRYVEEYSYESPVLAPKGGLVFEFDHSRFINHSDTPNTDHRSGKAYALRDIAVGEELTCDYRELSAAYAGLAYVQKALVLV